MPEAKHLKIGALGEDIACRFLVKRGFKIKERNYRKKWGELDIIAKRNNKLYFVEVKSVSRENISDVIHETSDYRPEENVHPKKLQRLGRTIQTYLLEYNIEDTEWQFDVVTVLVDVKNKKAKVKILEDIVL